VKARRVKGQRQVVKLSCQCRDGWKPIKHNCSILLTRIIGPRGRSYDTDNLSSSLKATRDGIADALRVKDNDKRVTWIYAQERGEDHAVRIEVTHD